MIKEQSKNNKKNMARGEHLKGKTPNNGFREGQSGNPNGRPKGKLDSKTVLNKLLEHVVKAINPLTGEEGEFTNFELMTAAILLKAQSGDVAAYNALIDRLEGKAKQTANISINAAHNLRYVTELKTYAEFDREMERIAAEEKALDEEYAAMYGEKADYVEVKDLEEQILLIDAQTSEGN
jgi:Family of unknown function (DUF5681)